MDISSMSYEERFSFLWRLIEFRKPFILYGPAGSGKSYIGLRLMERFIEERFGPEYEYIKLQDIDDEFLDEFYSGKTNVRGLYIAGSSNVTKFDVLGGRTLSEGSYVRRPGILSFFRRNGGIVFFDEISSIPPNFTILLNEIIDSIINGEAHKDFFIFFAANPSSYIGTEELPTSTLERLVLVNYGYYPFETEVRIVTNLLKKRISIEQDALDVFVRFIVNVVRRLREELDKAGYRDIPLSVRSMETLGLSIIALADGKPVKFTRDTRVYEHLYALIYGKLPRTKISVLKDKNVAKLIRFFEANGITMDTVREAILMLGVFAEMLNNRHFMAMVRSIV